MMTDELIAALSVIGALKINLDEAQAENARLRQKLLEHEVAKDQATDPAQNGQGDSEKVDNAAEVIAP